MASGLYLVRTGASAAITMKKSSTTSPLIAYGLCENFFHKMAQGPGGFFNSAAFFVSIEDKASAGNCEGLVLMLLSLLACRA
ncbi:hypothetical protein D3C75_1021780 [compost metagenome]